MRFYTERKIANWISAQNAAWSVTYAVFDKNGILRAFFYKNVFWRKKVSYVNVFYTKYIICIKGKKNKEALMSDIFPFFKFMKDFLGEKKTDKCKCWFSYKNMRVKICEKVAWPLWRPGKMIYASFITSFNGWHAQWAQVLKINSHNIHTTLVLRYKYFNQMISFYYVGKRFFS